jgi:hypothetical protein
MQSARDEQLFDLADKGIVGKVNGNGGDAMANQILQERHLTRIASEILQPGMHPDSRLKERGTVGLGAVLFLTKPPLVWSKRERHRTFENTLANQP